MFIFAGVKTTAKASSTGSTYYVDSQNGNDENDGLSEAKAWKTLTKVSNTKFNPGDKILFKRGCEWNGIIEIRNTNGAEGNPIIIDAYGEGSRPRINAGGKDRAFLLLNSSYWEINNLEITNDDDFNNNSNSARQGIIVMADNYGKLSHIYIKNCYVHDVDGQAGNADTGGIIFKVTGTIIPSWFDYVIVEGNHIQNCDREGIIIAKGGSAGALSTNIRVIGNVIEDIEGDGIAVTYCQ